MTPRFVQIANAIVQVCSIGINVLAAALNFHQHRYGAAAWNLGCAVFLIGFNIFLARAQKRDAQRHAALMAELRIRQAEMIRRTEESVMSQEVLDKSLKNLALVVQAVGAERIGTNWYGPYLLKVKEYFFRVGHDSVYSSPEEDGDEDEDRMATCIQSGGLPPAEVIATLLLLLKHDPELFERWRNDNGTYYGA